MFKILDCTLRDGGYYTNWDFDRTLVQDYCHAISNLPVSYIEVGYRSLISDGYTGQYYNLPLATLQEIHDNIPRQTKIAIMLDAKNVQPENISSLLNDCKEIVTMIRLAVDPDKLAHGLSIAQAVKDEGYEVGLNLMYLSKNWNNEEMYQDLSDKAQNVDCISLVDSFGACYPNQVAHAFKMARSYLQVPLGFHGHDNMTLAFANAIAAIDNGADIIDSTVLGMGRGAGNLRTEIIAGYHSKLNRQPTDLLPLANLLENFSQMQMKYGWGTTLPYIIAGFGELPQKDVMNWLGQNRYSTFSIVNALQGKSNEALHPLSAQNYYTPNMSASQKYIIIGGGQTAVNHRDAILDCAKLHNAILIHASVRNIQHYLTSGAPQLLCLLGDEVSKIKANEIELYAEKIERFILAEDDLSHTKLPPQIQLKASLIKSLSEDIAPDDALLGQASPLGTAFGVPLLAHAQEVWLAGFDGYGDTNNSIGQDDTENQKIIDTLATHHTNIKISSLTPTKYKIREVSVYARNMQHNPKNF